MELSREVEVDCKESFVVVGNSGRVECGISEDRAPGSRQDGAKTKDILS